MANNIAGRPWFLDTAGVITTMRVYIAELVWTEQVAAGDHLIIKDNRGIPIVDSRADAPNDYQRFGKLGWVNGINIDTKDSGTVLLFP